MKIQITKNEIREKFNLPIGIEIEVMDDAGPVLGSLIGNYNTTVNQPVGASLNAPIKPQTITVDFPALTAKEILKKVDNKAGDGKLLYAGFDGWYAKEDFYTKEKTRKGKRNVDLFFSMRDKSWNECHESSPDDMLNFAEVVYLLAFHPEFREVLRYGNDSGAWWTWTSSRDSGGGLVRVGGFDGRGADVRGHGPGYRSDGLGLVSSRVE